MRVPSDRSRSRVLAVVPARRRRAGAASEQFGDLDVSFLSLQVNDRGEALVTYRTTAGTIRHVYVWGAINANAPDPEHAAGAVQLRLLRRPAALRTPDLAHVRGPLPPLRRAEARLARGRLQGARRLLLGAAALAAAAADARHPPVPAGAGAPTSSTSRTGRGRCPCSRCRRTGRTAAGGRGCSAGSPTSASPPTASGRRRREQRDAYARFFYVDTFDSAFGPGWRHDAGKVAHSRNGAFCYSFVPQWTPAGYPVHVLRPPGNGKRHRVTVMGPGVTPVIQWEGAALGATTRSRTRFQRAASTRSSGRTTRSACTSAERVR